MDWLKKIAAYAPDIAAAIATGGGSVIASTALRIAAKELTGDEGADVHRLAIAANDATTEQLTALARANNEFLIALEELDVERLKAVNRTMQVESQSEHWWQSAWRPFWGFISALAFLGLVIAVGFLAFEAIEKGNQNAMVMIPQLISSATMLFGIPAAILGVASWHRGKEKRIKAGEHQLNSSSVEQHK
ncbi:3TM-type holin [Neptuniibacter halophilus]|uniref:3TM-type holin n=1 Tax=Neptuniibacter halophilus TaxID=651666 RepID=UPI0025732D3E|nr:3TM-type holin [Neptuniibacter halophilus]